MRGKEGTNLCVGCICPVNHVGYIRVREGRGRFECDCLSKQVRTMGRKEGTCVFFVHPVNHDGYIIIRIEERGMGTVPNKPYGFCGC